VLRKASVINNQSNVFQQQPSDAFIVRKDVINGKVIINVFEEIEKQVDEKVGEK
jgi:hypothetical protein